MVPTRWSGGGAREPMVVWWNGVSDIGRFRKLNEDACLCLACGGEAHEIQELSGRVELEDLDFVCAVSDGMGGANAGDRASQLVVEQMHDAIPRAFRSAASGFDPDYAGLLEKSVESIHESINREGEDTSGRRGMGATLSMCWFSPRRLWIAHVGDSRVYRFRAGRLRQMTEDHTRVGDLLRKGLINERQARMHPRKNILQQVLGGGIDRIRPQIRTVDFKAGDRFLVCSDGLIDGLWDRNLVEGFELAEKDGMSPEALTEYFLRRSLDASGRDNTTLVVVGIEAVEGE